MRNLTKKLWELAINEEGASAVEYGLLVAAIAAVIVTVVFTLGSQVKTAFSNTTSAISANITTPTQ